MNADLTTVGLLAAIIAGGFRFMESIIVKALPNRKTFNEDDHRMITKIYETNLSTKEILSDIKEIAKNNAELYMKIEMLIETFLSKGNSGNR